MTHTFENEVKATIHNPDSKGTVTNPGKTVDPNIKLNKDIKIVGEIKPLPGKVISNPPITPTPSIKPIPGLRDNIKDLIQTVPVGIPLTTAVKLEFLQDKPHQVQLRIEVEAGALRKDRMLRIQAISKTGQMLVQEIHTPRQTNAYVETVTLNSEGIHTVVLSPSQFSGRLVEVCFERTKVTLPEKPTYPTPCLRALEMPWFRPTDYKQRDTYNRLLDNQLQDLEEKLNQESGLIFETGSSLASTLCT